MADEANQSLRKYGSSGDNPVTAPDYTKKEGERILKALREAQPSRLRNPPAVVIAPASRQLEWNQGFVIRNERADPFDAPATEVAEDAAAAAIPNIAFLLENASNIVDGEPNNRVNVLDGKINGQYPIGMGFGEYIIDLSNPEDAIIYVGITFNPTTLEITSRFLGESTAALFPESRVESATEGFAYWQLGFTFFDADGAFTIWQTKLGNIDFEFVYGALNGKAALLPVDTQPGWMDLDLV